MMRCALLSFSFFIGACVAIVCGLVYKYYAGYLPPKIEDGCLLLNASFSNYSCSGTFSSTPYAQCSNPYIQTNQVAMRLDKHEAQRVCGYNKYQQCQCCVNTFGSSCQPLPVQINDDCALILNKDLAYYNNFQTGKIYECWENEAGYPSFEQPNILFHWGLIAGMISGCIVCFLVCIIAIFRYLTRPEK